MILECGKTPLQHQAIQFFAGFLWFPKSVMIGQKPYILFSNIVGKQSRVFHPPYFVFFILEVNIICHFFLSYFLIYIFLTLLAKLNSYNVYLSFSIQNIQTKILKHFPDFYFKLPTKLVCPFIIKCHCHETGLKLFFVSLYFSNIIYSHRD